MRRICKYCGKEYDGDPGSSCCPDCAAWEAAHRPERNAYQLERYHRRKDDKKD